MTYEPAELATESGASAGEGAVAENRVMTTFHGVHIPFDEEVFC